MGIFKISITSTLKMSTSTSLHPSLDHPVVTVPPPDPHQRQEGDQAGAENSPEKSNCRYAQICCCHYLLIQIKPSTRSYLPCRIILQVNDFGSRRDATLANKNCLTQHARSSRGIRPHGLPPDVRVQNLMTRVRAVPITSRELAFLVLMIQYLCR